MFHGEHVSFLSQIFPVAFPKVSRNPDSLPGRPSSLALVSFRLVLAGERLVSPTRRRRDDFSHPDDAGPF